MKVFNRNGKANFVDENNVFVGFDNSQSCCEDFGWYFSDTKPVSMKEIPLGEDNQFNADGWNFDKDFFELVEAGRSDEGGIAVFRLVKDSQQAFLCLHNSHNGYYSHGFSMDVGGATVREGNL